MNVKKTKLLFYSGKRGGINHFIPIISKLAKLNSFNLHLLLSDMHLSKKFGLTHKNYKKLKIKIHKSNTLNQNYNGSKFERALSLSTGMKKNIMILKKIKPDLLIVLGDRAELYSISVPALIFNIPIAHFYGGDLTQGCTDEPTRHSISMISNFHFVSNLKSKENLIKLRIDKKKIFNVGLLSLHSIDKKKLENKKNIFKKYNLDINKKLFIIIQHPETWRLSNTEDQIKNTLAALKNFNANKVFIYPCSDPGYKIIINELKKNLLNDSMSKIFKDINYKDFYSLFLNANLIIGNSSCGILESYYFNTPAINLGERQKNRYQTKNILNCNFAKKDIVLKIRQALKKKNIQKKGDSFYYNKNGLNNIYDIFKNLNYNKDSNFKQILKFK